MEILDKSKEVWELIKEMDYASQIAVINIVQEVVNTEPLKLTTEKTQLISKFSSAVKL